MASKCFTNFLLILIIRLLVGRTLLFPVLMGLWGAISAWEFSRYCDKENERGDTND